MKQINELFLKAIAGYKKLSPRERIMVIGAGLVFIVIVTTELITLLYSSFESQVEKKNQTISSLNETVVELGKYQRLKNRKIEIEEAYKEVEISEGARSHLESLLKDKAGIVSGYVIDPKPPRQFGDKYEQTSFDVRFTTTDFARLIRFLSELTSGDKPMILSSLDVRKRPSGDSVEVSLEVSSVSSVSNLVGTDA